MSLPIFVRKCRSDHLHTRLYTSGAFFIVMMIKCQIFEPACWLNLFTQLNTISVEPCLYGYLYWCVSLCDLMDSTDKLATCELISPTASSPLFFFRAHHLQAHKLHLYAHPSLDALCNT